MIKRYADRKVQQDVSTWDKSHGDDVKLTPGRSWTRQRNKKDKKEAGRHGAIEGEEDSLILLQTRCQVTPRSNHIQLSKLQLCFLNTTAAVVVVVVVVVVDRV